MFDFFRLSLASVRMIRTFQREQGIFCALYIGFIQASDIVFPSLEAGRRTNTRRSVERGIVLSDRAIGFLAGSNCFMSANVELCVTAKCPRDIYGFAAKM